jgi:cobyrinic acid a,c-diamide synthase
VLPSEVQDLERRLATLAYLLVLNDCAWNDIPKFANLTAEVPVAEPQAPGLRGKVVAIARDEAFAFIYPANVRCLQALGASIAWFSPLADETLPEIANAVILPGGYPELHAAVLSRAQGFHASLRRAHARGVPILAECGGMMVLADVLVDLNGQGWPMAGMLPGTTRMQSRLAGLGLQAWDTGCGVLRGHTFHYSTFDTPLAGIARTVTHPKQAAGEMIFRRGSITASYFHAYFPSCPRAAAALLA